MAKAITNNKCEVCGSQQYTYFSTKHKKYLCRRHTTQMNRHGKVYETTLKEKGETICSVCGKSEGRMYSRFCKFDKSLCSKHYRQMEKHGKIKEQTTRDPNKIIKYNTHAEIITHDRDGNDNHHVKIDLDDIKKINLYKWSKRGNRISSTGENRVYLHRFIMDAPDNMIVDHINHDVLDNRKCNLRVCTVSNNNMNRSGVVGVTQHYNRFRARIKVSGKQIELGNYNTLKEAARVRKDGEKKYFGQYAYNEVVA